MIEGLAGAKEETLDLVYRELGLERNLGQRYRVAESNEALVVFCEPLLKGGTGVLVHDRSSPSQ
jgi:hypothetical protein